MDAARDFLIELELAEEAKSVYERLHRVIRMKSEWTVKSFVENWVALKPPIKDAFFDSLNSAEVAEIQDFLATSVRAPIVPEDRALIIQHAIHFTGLHCLVPILLEAYPDLTVDLQREVQWFLLNVGTGRAMRFLNELVEESTKIGMRPPAITGHILSQTFLGTKSVELGQLAGRFHGYYSPIDEWDLKAWLSQFGQAADQSLMLQLLKCVRYFDQKAIGKASDDLWSSLPPDDRRQAYVTGLGPLAKSGTHILYEFRPTNGFDRKQQIQDLPSILRSANSDPLVIAFLDDIIGSGHQALRFYNVLLEQTNSAIKLSPREILRLRKAKKYLLAVAGFDDGRDRVRNAGVFHEVSVSTTLQEADKAFSAEARIFDELNDLRFAKQIAEFYGSYLYPRGRDAEPGTGPGPLGYEDCQALVVFYYNTPNNTLPILWQNGRVRSRDWLPLFRRRE